MSRIECYHVKYCENCDRYGCLQCGCACDRKTRKEYKDVNVIESEISHLKSQLALCVEALDYIRKISYNEGFKIYRNDKDLVKTTLDKLAAMQSEGEK